MRARGFTLIELAVAVFITALMAAIGYGAVNQALKNRDGLEARQQRLLEVQRTMRILAQDFGQLAPRVVRDPTGDTWEPVLRGAESGEPLVTLTRAGWANPAGIQRPALQRVAYFFQDNKLRREHWPVLDALLSTKPVERELLTGVRAVTIRYMDVGRQWRRQWPPQSAANDPTAVMRLRPIAVEVTLDLEDWGKVTRIFEVPT